MLEYVQPMVKQVLLLLMQAPVPKLDGNQVQLADVSHVFAVVLMLQLVSTAQLLPFQVQPKAVQAADVAAVQDACAHKGAVLAL